MKERAQSKRTSRRNPLISRSNNCDPPRNQLDHCDPPTNNNHRDHPSNDLAASSSALANSRSNHQSRRCHLKLNGIAWSSLLLPSNPTKKILPPPLPLSFSQSISLPLSQSVSSLRKIEFCFVLFCFFGLYIGIFYYNICLEAKKMWENSRKCVF